LRVSYAGRGLRAERRVDRPPGWWPERAAQRFARERAKNEKGQLFAALPENAFLNFRALARLEY